MVLLRQFLRQTAQRIRSSSSSFTSTSSSFSETAAKRGNVNLLHQTTANITFFPRELLKAYKDLSKFRLSMFVVSTATAGAFLGGGIGEKSKRNEEEQAATTSASSIEAFTKRIAHVSFGTALCAFSANSLNQVIERANDARMARTMRRPLPSGRLSVAHALAFSAISGFTGVLWLNENTNAETATLGGGNILLYTCVYTPLKQLHWINTWVGAVVGAIPPAMGYAAMQEWGGKEKEKRNNEEVVSFVEEHAKGFVLPLAVYLWQIPHFMALAAMGRDDYIRGGYNMLSHPKFDPTLRRVANVALRNSLMLLPLGFVAVNVGLVASDSTFRYEAIALGTPLVVTAMLFRNKLNVKSARRMFYGSLAYLPAFQFALCIRNGGQKIVVSDDDKSADDDLVTLLLTPFIALHNNFLAVRNDNCPSVAMAQEDAEHTHKHKRDHKNIKIY